MQFFSLSLAQQFLAQEAREFAALSKNLQLFLLSATLYGLAFPILFVFINAFVLRQGQGMSGVIFFNLGSFIAIPVFFYLNNLLWRWFSPRLLLSIGAFGQGLVLMLILFSSGGTLSQVAIFGALLGAPIGIYWANRNYLEVVITHDGNRNYYSGLKQASSTITSTCAPLLVGLFIKLAEVTGWYSVELAYKVVGGVTFSILCLAGFAIFRGSFVAVKSAPILGLRADVRWQWFRLVQFAWGWQGGVLFIFPSLLVFALLGSEETLGVLQSLSAVLSSVVFYWLGKKMRVNQRLNYLLFSLCSLIFLSTVLFLNLTAQSAFFYLLLAGTLSSLGWFSRDPLTYSLIEKVAAGPVGSKDINSYILDGEAWLNLGRLSFLGVLGMLLARGSELATLSINAGLTAGILLLCIFCVPRMRAHQS